MENNRQTCADYVSMYKIRSGHPMSEENVMTPTPHFVNVNFK